MIDLYNEGPSCRRVPTSSLAGIGRAVPCVVNKSPKSRIPGYVNVPPLLPSLVSSAVNL